MRASEFVSLLRAYAGTAPFTSVLPINVSSLVLEMLQLVKATASKNVAFSTTVDERLPSIPADISQLRQVILNLLTNACESLPRGEGSVHISTASFDVDTDSELCRHGHLLPGKYVQLRVTDNGSGIPMECQNKIFDPFYTTKSLGRGLGLAAVQGIIRNLNGGIHFESIPGQGSTFEVLLPYIRYNASAIDSPLQE